MFEVAFVVLTKTCLLVAIKWSASETTMFVSLGPATVSDMEHDVLRKYCPFKPPFKKMI